MNNILYFKLLSEILREIKQVEFWNILSLLCGDLATVIDVTRAFLGTRNQFQYFFLVAEHVLSTAPRCYCSSLNVCASVHSIKPLGWEAGNTLASAILICGLNFIRDVTRHFKMYSLSFCGSLVETCPRRVSLANHPYYGCCSMCMERQLWDFLCFSRLPLSISSCSIYLPAAFGCCFVNSDF